MISASATLPILVLFERHWDQEPKHILNGLIPELSEEGYNTLCLEAPQNLTEEDIIFSYSKGLELDRNVNSQAHEYVKTAGFKNVDLCNLGFKKLAELMRLYVSSQRYLHVAEKIKLLPASTMLKEIFNNSRKFHFTLKGVDINTTDYQEFIDLNVVQRRIVLEKKEECRISIFFKNLLDLHQQGKGVVFACGALHAENLINRFKQHGMENHVLYYFSHSNKNYDDSINDVKEILSNQTLKDHTFCLVTPQDRVFLKKKIICDIKSNNTNYKEKIIEGSSSSRFLTTFFNKNFEAWMRPGYHVDALLDISSIDDWENVAAKVEQVSIPVQIASIEEKKYLVIRDINTKEIGDNLRLLN